jgi:ABC-type Fe3+-hydroxamate transport system substrate-binding protein
MKRFFVFLFLMFLMFCLTGHGQQKMRIVSLAPSLTQNLYYLGLQDQIVGVTSYCEIAKPDNKTVIATAIQVNHERVVMQKPDLVIATGMTNPETIATLRQFGIRVEVFGKVHSFDEICTQFTRLGALTGREERATEIISEVRYKVQSLLIDNPDHKKPRIFFQIGAKPIYTVIPDTFMDDYIRFAGGVNIAAGLTIPTITRESVVVANPDVIIIVTMGITGEEEESVWRRYRSVNAIKNNRIIIIDANKASSPTPIAFLQTLEEIINRIYR